VPHYWYENEIQAKQFAITCTFRHGSQAEIVEHLKALGGTHCRWRSGVYMDFLIVGSKTKPELIEKRKAEKIRLRKEEQERRSRINDAKEKIRQDLKAELEKKIFEAEEAIASGSEYKKKAGGKRNK
jgi:hypothetical protein